MKFLGNILSVIIVVTFIFLTVMITFDLVVGSVQLAHWLLTGEMFKIVNIDASSVF